MNFQYQGTCQCGQVTFTLSLPNNITSYAPRKCDCSYCMEKDLAYLSDPGGTLSLQSNGPFKEDTQGSKQAKFLSCGGCGNLVVVMYDFGKALKGAVNARLLTEKFKLLEDMAVSPKSLNTEEKIERWESLWLEVLID